MAGGDQGRLTWCLNLLRELKKGPTILVEVEFVEQIPHWTVSRCLNIEGIFIFNTRAMIGAGSEFGVGKRHG